MKLIAKLAWRNIWRNKRRSIITIAAVTFAVMLSIVMRGIQLGTYDANIKYVVELFDGYLQVQVPGYQKTPTLQKSFRVDDRVKALLDGEPLIVGYAPRVIGNGLASFKDNSQGALIVGLDPGREMSVSKIPSRIAEGNFLRADALEEIIVGEKLLGNLQANIGDEIVILAQSFDGSLGNLKFRIVGTVKTGLGDFDRSIILMNLSAAQDLLVMYNRVNLLAIRLHDLSEIVPVKESLMEPLGSQGLALLSWNEVMPDLEQGIKLDNVSGILMLGILIVVVAFGITNTVLMSVTERFREFGIILSIGMQQRMLIILIFLETVIIVLIGLIIGNALAYGINSYIVQNPIEFTGEYGDIYSEYGWLPRIESTLRLSSFFNTTLSILIISVLATLYPITKVYRLEPLKGIRYT